MASMKPMLAGTVLFEAFVSGGIGASEAYPWWTTIWGLRSGSWRDKSLSKQARKTLGGVTKSAIEDGKSGLFQKLSRALEETVAFEREPENVQRGNIYFAIYELNATVGVFDRSDVLAWLKAALNVSISAEDLDLELVRLNLADQIPCKVKRGKRSKRSQK